MTRLYLDWNATTPLRPEAKAAMVAAMELVGNPSSVHAEGRAAKALMERSRAKIAAALGAEGADVVFTVRVRLDSPYTGPASLSNTAAVDIPGDPVPGNNTSTVPKDVGNPPPPAAIPTLSEWGLILLSLLLGVLALRQMPVRRRW